MATLIEQPPAPPAAAGRLAPEQLARKTDPGQFAFRTTDDLPDAIAPLGQERAVAATEFGVGIRREGYNLFVFGPEGVGKHAVLRGLLERRAAGEPPAPDRCYVHNFETPHRPRLLSLPTGRGVVLRADMARLVDDLRTAIPAALDSDEYRARQESIERDIGSRRDRALGDLRERAAAEDVALIQTPVGFGLAVTRGGEVLDAEAVERLPEDQRTRLQAAMTAFSAELEKIVRQVPRWRRERRERMRELKRAVTSTLVDALMDEVRKKYEGLPDVQAYLDAVQGDVIENADDFRRTRDGEEPEPLDTLIARASGIQGALGRYQVNVLDSRPAVGGAPVVYEDNPTFQNLMGRIDHVAHLGTLTTDFTLIKPGALHRANGGYLLLDAHRVLMEPFAWAALKRALRSREVRVESLAQNLSLITTVSLEPEPMPLDLKIVLIGDPTLHYLLFALDPDFKDLFKVGVDFDDRLNRSPETQVLFAQLVATAARREHLLPLTAAGVARVIDHAARKAEDASKLSLGVAELTDLLREADHWARLAGRAVIEAEDVQRAIDAAIDRLSRPRERMQEEMSRGTISIATRGVAIGQVNGLSVIDLGGFAFARPSRITARVRLGEGTVVDIERQVELGGPIHSKGVLILSGFLAGRYVPDHPLCLSASLVFEQSYGPVEGDSASLAELCALLSALAGVPIHQGFAVTGSVNQVGEVQAIGAVNEKIEGFFDTCAAAGLTGTQGVLIPAANVRHLMLRDDVVDAVRSGAFCIHAVATIDQALEALTGMGAGTRSEAGAFAADTINARVEERLITFARRTREFAAEPAKASGRRRRAGLVRLPSSFSPGRADP